MNSTIKIFTGGADSKEVLELLIGDTQSNYYIDKTDLLLNENEVAESDIRQFRVTITVEEVEG